MSTDFTWAKEPRDCKLFVKACTLEHPIGLVWCPAKGHVPQVINIQFNNWKNIYIMKLNFKENVDLTIGAGGHCDVSAFEPIILKGLIMGFSPAV